MLLTAKWAHLQHLLTDDVLVSQAVNQREGVVHCHGDIRTKTLQKRAKSGVCQGLHSGHDAAVEPQCTGGGSQTHWNALLHGWGVALKELKKKKKYHLHI